MHRALSHLLKLSLALALGVVAGVFVTPSHALASPAAAPVITVPSAQTVDEGVLLSFLVTATDADGQPLVFRAAGLPAGSTFHDNHNNSATFSWTPSFTQAGTYGPTFIADDTFGGVDSKGVPITVRNVNQAPVLDPIGDRQIERGSMMFVSVGGTDPDGDALTLTTANLPSWASFSDFGDGSGSLQLAPPADMTPATVSMTVTLSDGSLSSSETFSITVYALTSANAPVLAPIANQTVAEGTRVNLNVSATDADGDVMTWTVSLPTFATFTPTGSGPGATSGTVSMTPDYCASGTYSASLAVSDGALSDSKSFTITVTNVNRLPVWSTPQGGYSMSLNEGTSANLSMSASDPDQQCGTGAPTLLYPGSSPSGLTVSMSDQGSGNGLLHVAADFASAGTYTLMVRAQDATDAAATTDVPVRVTVVSVDRAPIAVAGGPYSGLVGNAISMSAAGSSDPDGDALTYAWAFGDGGSDTGAEVSHAYAAWGHYLVVLTVSDGSLSGMDSTSADVRSGFLARAFPGHGIIRLKTGKPLYTIYLEPVGGSFDVESVDVTSLMMYGPDGLGTATCISPVAGSVVVGGDSDRNGVAEVSMDFARDDLRSLFTNLTQDMDATLVLTARLLGGGTVRATLGWSVQPERKLVTRIQPNPMNPETTIRVNLEVPEALSIRFYDARGRLVRTFMENVDTPAGVHDYHFDGRGSNGLPLPTGQYFYRAETPTARTHGAVMILK